MSPTKGIDHSCPPHRVGPAESVPGCAYLGGQAQEVTRPPASMGTGTAAVNPVTYVDDWAIVGQDAPPSVVPFRDLTSVVLDDQNGSWDPCIPVSARIATIRREDAVSPPQPPRAFDDVEVNRVSQRVLDGYRHGQPIQAVLGRAQAERSALRMRPEIARLTLAHYPRLRQLLMVMQSVTLMLEPGFIPVPVPRFSAKYASEPARSLVNAKLAKAAAKGHYLLLNHAAADAVRARERGLLHDNPLGWVPKTDSPLGRVTTNCSYGVAGGYAESLNHRTDAAAVAAVFGDPTVHTVHDLARAVLQAESAPGAAPAIAVADASGAFTWIDLHWSASLLMSSSVRDDNVSLAVPLSANFGYTSTPTWWREVADAISWVVRVAPIGWYRSWMRSGAPADAVIMPLPPSGRPRPLHAESVHDLLQSLLAAMALVVCPADPAAPVVNLEKVRPGDTTSMYVGWVVDAKAKCVRLPWRGMKKLLRVLFISIPPAAVECSMDALRSTIGVLQHYAALWPALACLLQSLYHLLKRYAPRRRGGRRSRPTLVTLGNAVSTDLRCWRMVATAIYKDPTLGVLPLEHAAGTVTSPFPPVDTDACTVGAGTFHPSGVAIRATWTEAELDAVRVGGRRVLLPMPNFVARRSDSTDTDRYDICLLEFAWVVYSVLVMGPRFEGGCLALRCDNVAAVSWASRHRSRNPAAHDLARVLAWATLSFRLFLQPSFLPGVQNIDADALSRWHQPEMPEIWSRRHPDLIPMVVSMDSQGAEGRARRLVYRAITGTLGAGWIERLPGVFARRQ